MFASSVNFYLSPQLSPTDFYIKNQKVCKSTECAYVCVHLTFSNDHFNSFFSLGVLLESAKIDSRISVENTGSLLS